MDDAEPSSLLLRLLAITLLVAANGFFVATEFALVTVRRSRVETLAEKGNASARLLLQILARIDDYIAATQLGITVASIGLGWIGEPALARVIGWLFTRVLPPAWSQVAAHSLAIAMAFFLITYLHVVIGELAPKTLALERGERIALSVARPLRLFYLILWPLIRALNRSGLGFLKLLRIRPVRETHALYAEEIQQLINVSRQRGLIKAHEHQLLSNIFDFGDITVKDVMRPRADVTAIEEVTPLGEVVKVFTRSGYSRLPVYRGRVDQIIGVLYSKDLLAALDRSRTFDLRSVLRRPFFVPETASIGEVLRQMRSKKNHFAMVVDEYGAIEGIVTLEDILEELVGEIQDEYDHDEVDHIVRQPDGSYLLNGTLSVREANRRLQLDLPESDDYSTLAGFLMSRSGKLPARGEQVNFGGVRFTIERIQGRRIARVRMERLKKQVAQL